MIAHRVSKKFYFGESKKAGDDSDISHINTTEHSPKSSAAHCHDDSMTEF